MSEWKSASLSGLIPSEIATIASQAQTITGTVATLLGIIKSAIDLARPIAGFPNIDFASALIAAVEAFKDDFLGFGFYSCSMWDYPLKQYYRSGTSGEEFGESFQADLVLSLSDPYDPNVPPFSSNAAMLVLVGGTSGELADMIDSVLAISNAFPTWTDIAKAYDKMYRAVWTDFIDSFAESMKSGEQTYSSLVSQQSARVKELLRAKWDALENLSTDDLADIASSALESLADVETFIADVNARVAAPTYPDWESTTLKKILPPLVDLVDQALEPLIAALQGGAGILAAIDGFLEVVDFKIVQLQLLVDKIDTFLEALENIASLGSLYALYVTTSNGVAGLAQELQYADNAPFGDDNGYFFGVAFVAGGPGLTPFSNVFSGVAA